jgi:sec-independent protein translocase protein TatC
MTLGEHLDELRVRLMRAVVALGVVFAVAWAYNLEVGQIALAPLEEKARVWLNEDIFAHWKGKAEAGELSQEELKEVFFDGEVDANKLREPVPSVRTDGAAGSFIFMLKVCGFAAFFIAGPFVLWQMWGFIAAGLYRNERRAVYRYFPASVGLFFAGVLFGYFYFVPYAYYYLASMGQEITRHDPKIEDYFVFLKSLGLGMGLVFQLPVLMMGVARVGLIDPKDFSKYRRQFFVAALIISAIITPADPYTMLMMAVPMIVLYEAGIILARIAARKASTGPGSSVEPSA